VTVNQLNIESISRNGDCALTVNFVPNDSCVALIHTLCTDLLRKPLPDLLNLIPAFNSLTLVFKFPVNQLTIVYEQLLLRLDEIQLGVFVPKTHYMPTCYHPDVAADLLDVCRHLGLEVDDLIERHAGQTYQIAMLGFLPGFAYLNENHQTLYLNRKASPSLHVQAGSVAIAGKQTGIYSLASPGGWHVIGMTPKKVLNWQNQHHPMLLNPLDQVVFNPIDLVEYQSLKNES